VLRNPRKLDGEASRALPDQVRRHQPRAQPCRRQPEGAIDVVERPKDRSRRIGRPVRRTEALNPAALLVDQDRRIRLTD